MVSSVAPPVIFEINTMVWLRELSSRLGRAVGLGSVPAAAWDEKIPDGTDTVWLMGVWERSPAGISIALQDAAAVGSFREAVVDLRTEDVVGSPYCVRRYTVDPALGGEAGLAAARDELRRRGRRLILDFVPNHVAIDHPWTAEHPDFLIRGGPEDLQRNPGAFLEAAGTVFARGRDPYFAPWPDVLQLNAFHPGLRQATAATLQAIGERADGVRCDMAMLMLNDVFSRTWGDRPGGRPDGEFWPDVIASVRRAHPGMWFIAEAYWDLEWELQQQGFDFCYDKRLYDRLVNESAESVRSHLTAGEDYQRRLVRFIENHDEPRAAAVMSPGRERAAAVAIATLPGAQLWHEGQFEGHRTHLPVFLGRRPAEPTDTAMTFFYERLLGSVQQAQVRSGSWRLLEAEGWPDNPSGRNLLAWAWSGPAGHHVIVINFSDSPAQGLVAAQWADDGGQSVRLIDLLDDRIFERPGSELVSKGLFVSLEPWAFHVLAVNPS